MDQLVQLATWAQPDLLGPLAQLDLLVLLEQWA
jgi:hypothetical protein